MLAVVGYAIAGQVVLTVFVLHHKNTIDKMTTFWTVNSLILSIVLLAMVLLEVKLTSVPVLVFCKIVLI